MKKIITMTAWRRAHYFKEVIESIVNAEGSEEYHLIISIDGGYSEQQNLMKEVLEECIIEHTVYVHEENKGCAWNTGFVLRKGFEQAERVIHLEDDTVLHVDALKWFEYNLDKYEENPLIWSISAWNLGNDTLVGEWTEIDIVGIRQKFTCGAWAMWKSRYDEISTWFGVILKDELRDEFYNFVHNGNKEEVSGDNFLEYVDLTDKGSWGYPMDYYWRAGRYEIAPHVSMNQNIGREYGSFNTPALYDLRQNSNSWRPFERIGEVDTDFVDEYLEELQ
jgi:glycosyltransferase involved in cell wall biosynthesis